MPSPSAADAPLILTLQLDEATQAFFDALRQKHFPPERNYLAAHLTLFHHLPGAELSSIEAYLAVRCRPQAPIELRVAGLQSLGQGVAYSLFSPATEALHRELQAHWQAHLTPQDQQRRHPHVTVQNKVKPEQARQLLAELQADFEPFEATGTGLQLWAYRGGPWELLRTFAFGENA
ncbi:2'-5' RNA ligase family protein [Hymenobacter gummosus]|uniref:2'-5' RNA ligase family protein n=1 Tax=Hymenobacter gummosus TaxID=1776032 RepID=A0A3S0IMF9_9BACT|nr:2'-5' RNA ligase family protein [Hymenobacter gummosus]RTQ48855.1 2'-5' RNA ligase family protein [Hymenobacter gummosus]